jgi:hypothetical protein
MLYRRRSRSAIRKAEMLGPRIPRVPLSSRAPFRDAAQLMIDFGWLDLVAAYGMNGLNYANDPNVLEHLARTAYI